MLTTLLDLAGLVGLAAAFLVAAFLLLGPWGLVGALVIAALTSLGGSYAIDRVSR